MSLPINRSFHTVLGLSAVTAIGIGGYFFHQFQALAASPPPLATPRPAQQSAAPAVPPAVAQPEPTAAATALAEIKLPQTAQNAVPPRHRAANATQADPASIRVSTSTSKLDSALGEGYRSLHRGDFEAARSAYEAALGHDPRNTDALLGLAVVAGREGHGGRAEELYLQALVADPKNAVAQAALVNLRHPIDPIQSESRLKSLLGDRPADADPAGLVHFALGNVYATQRRWNEAQHAYFKAYSSDAGNPDYQYNLAVSLDHLQQLQLATRFYRSALSAAEARPALFDRARTEVRLAELNR